MIYDNLDDYSKAVESYKKFAVACSKTENAQQEALAYNCIGVDLMVMNSNGHIDVFLTQIASCQ